MRTEQKRRHHTEVAASSPQRPEKIRILVHAGRNQAPIRQYDIGREQIVDRQPVLPRQVTDAAAFAIFDITRGAIQQRFRGWSQGSLEEDIGFVFELLWKGLAR